MLVTYFEKSKKLVIFGDELRQGIVHMAIFDKDTLVSCFCKSVT